jgi:hypothetical protein
MKVDWKKTSSLLPQQDTIPKVSSIDTAEINTLGINPIFIEIEKKKQEVEEFKQKIALEAKKNVKKSVKPIIDTTCIWCTSKDVPTAFNLLELTVENHPTFFETKLYDKLYYKKVVNSPSLVFIETETSINNKGNLSYQTYPRANAIDYIEWVIFPLFLLFLTVCFLRFFYKKHLTGFFQSFLFYYSATRQNKESLLLNGRISLILDAIYFTIISVYVVLSYDLLFGLSNSQFPPLILGLFVLGGSLAFRLLQTILNKFIGFFSNNSIYLNELLFHQLIYPRVFGIIAIPFVFILAYSKGITQEISLYLIATSFIIMLILRLFRSLKVFLNKGFSIFYFLLYLCALEIIPVLILFKEIFRN